jgi:hypothetical protein
MNLRVGSRLERDEHLRLDLVTSAGSYLKRDECDFWDGFP